MIKVEEIRTDTGESKVEDEPEEMNDNVIELENVVKDYGDFVLDHVSLKIPRGSICGFVGQNGAGKTTTISLILDIIKPDAGNITVFGKQMKEYGKVLKEDIGVVFDEMGFHDFMTATQIGKYMKHVYKNWDDEEYAKITDIPKSMISKYVERGLEISIPYERSRGYISKINGKRGYYDVVCGDRGEVSVVMFTDEFLSARIKVLQEICHDLTYNYTISTPYYSKYLSIPLEEMKTEEDYRQYWFARLLQIEKQVLPEKDYLNEINHYTNCMNHRLDADFWEFNIETMQFHFLGDNRRKENGERPTLY